MEETQWLLKVAARHEREKVVHEQRDAYDDEEGELISSFGPYPHEAAFHRATVLRFRPKPDCFRSLSYPALIFLAYLFKESLDDDDLSCNSLIAKLQVDCGNTLTYLEEVVKLAEAGWIILHSEDDGEDPPRCYLRARVELGERFRREALKETLPTNGYASNEAFLDAMSKFLESQINEDHLPLCKSFQNNEFAISIRPFRRVRQRAEISTAELPAWRIREQYHLSDFQHICLIGMLFYRDEEIGYDFSDPNDIVNLFVHSRRARKLVREHLFGEASPLVKHGLIEFQASHYWDLVRLSSQAWRNLIGEEARQKEGVVDEVTLKKMRKGKVFDLEMPQVNPGKVCFPPSVHEAVATILHSETPKGKRLRDQWHSALPSRWGSPTGTTILLYGPSGTGKTLTAQYLASCLKRPLLKIDAAKILSCWVGESEQNVRKVFDQYRVIQEQYGVSPVLLLNEADQLLGARINSQDSVDKMNNNMQNLFLEGLEQFTGILVATTNRQELLDTAFSRRFTYKIELPKPSLGERRRIWRAHLPLRRLSADVDLDALAALDLAGGDIRLVVEKAARHAAFNGRGRLNQKALLVFAEEELLARRKSGGGHGILGFSG